jgi:hypothetical protein
MVMPVDFSPHLLSDRITKQARVELSTFDILALGETLINGSLEFRNSLCSVNYSLDFSKFSGQSGSADFSLRATLRTSTFEV